MRCEWEWCEGHLGKFGDCQAEALYELSMEPDERTGDVDWHGHYALVIVRVPESVHLGSDGRSYTVPVGSYLVETVSSGAVYVESLEIERFARQRFAEIDAAFGEWLDAEDELIVC